MNFSFFRGVECLGSPELKLDTTQLSPLLEKEMLTAVTDVFINERRQKFSEWIPNIVGSEVKVRYSLFFLFLLLNIRTFNLGLECIERC